MGAMLLGGFWPSVVKPVIVPTDHITIEHSDNEH